MSMIYSVTNIVRYIKNMFAGDYLLKNVQIKGELSNVKYHSSGHIYFTIKDEGAALNGIMFRSARTSGLSFELQNGQCVVATGSVSIYEKDSKCQIYVQKFEPAGQGNLYEAYERLKQKLFEEGLFDFEHKKEIPAFPKKVGIVTSKTGAAIRDIQNIAKRRNPFVQLYLYPAMVQGDGAAATIVQGIKMLDEMGMDTIIIGRGGGSIEELWPFNEEIVARAIFQAKTPIISGTGHETDNTIADYAADLRAPTPSAACELAIPDVMTLIQQTKQLESRLKQCMTRLFVQKSQQFEMLAAKIEHVSPKVQYENKLIYLDSLQDRLIQGMEQKYRNRKHQYEIFLTRLNGMSPTAKLVGGYGYIEGEKGQAVKSVEDVNLRETFTVTIHDGTISGVVQNIEKKVE